MEKRTDTQRVNAFMLREHMTAFKAMSHRTGLTVIALIRKAMAEFLERSK